jgi:transcriptional regulator with XRE-family HTH domain
MPTKKTPAKTPAQVFAAAVRNAREQRGWTQGELGARLTDLGLPFDRTMVAKVESYRRGVSLEDVLGFAVALGVPPASLLVPRSAADTVAVTPSTAVRSITLRGWVRGLGRLPREVTWDASDADDAFYRTALVPYYVTEADQRLPGVVDLEEQVDGILRAMVQPDDAIPAGLGRWEVVGLELQVLSGSVALLTRQAMLAEAREEKLSRG